MRILVIGGGGREHILVRKIKENNRVSALYCLPGNGGIAKEAECFPIATTDIPAIVSFAKAHAIDFAVVAPDDPLVLGAVDALEAQNIRCFGPNKKAAEIEGSKAFAKKLMRAYGIPTAAWETFTEPDNALAYVKAQGKYPVVIKADGLALGKGVIIAQSEAEAKDAIDSMMTDSVFGESGHRVVIEEFLTGPEVTLLAFTDGETLVPMISSMDHKRALDGDQGLNTGGMGVIAPSPFYTEEIARRCMEEIYLPTLRAMNAEERPFRGCLYFGLMLTADGPKVIEYNCRFGDPEAQAVLPLLETDLLTILEAIADKRLKDIEISFSPKASCCVMVASSGYPGAYKKGCPITIGEMPESVAVYHSGSAQKDGMLVTAGGRVLGITATGNTLHHAVEQAYKGAASVKFEGAYCRRDIGKRALEAK